MKYNLIALFFYKLFKVPFKIISIIEYNYFKIVFFINGAIKKIEKKQNENFKNLGLDRSVGLKKLADLTRLYPIIDNSMKSEHQVIFSSISENKSFNPKRILEIGTFDGINAFVLSQLFPNSEIITMDLESEDHEFTKFYDRNSVDKLDNFIKERNSILDKCENVQFYEKNSLYLINENKKFDLIWIDGAHGYPVLPIDISNAIRIISKDGYILCDDIYTFKNLTEDSMYKSYAGIRTLNALKKAEIINYKLFHKRINYENNCVPRNKKFVALVEKI